MEISFAGRVVVVAGGTGGLGRAVSLAFLEEGAKVIVTYRKEEEFLALKEAAAANLSSLEGHSLDVTDEAATSGFIHEALGQHGALDVLVNTVGGYAGGVKLWDLKTECPRPDAGAESSLRLQPRPRRRARDVESGTRLHRQCRGKAALDHGAGASAYAASKAAAVALMDSLAGDVKGTGVRVNSILPSIIDTAANRAAMPGSDFSIWPKPQDIANVVLFLASDFAKTIHGAAVPVYGYS